MRFIAPADVSTASSPLEWIKQDLHGLVQTVVFGGVAVLVILLVIRPLVLRIIETTMAASAADAVAAEAQSPLLSAPGIDRAPRLGGLQNPLMAEPAPEEEASIDISRVTGKVRSSTYNRLTTLVDKNPDEALNVIRQWATRRAG